jgi:pilus assembly protein CpaE
MSSQEVAKQPHRSRVLVIPGPDPVGDWMANVIKAEQDMVLLGLVRDLARLEESIGKLLPDVILVDISSGILEHGDLINRLAAPLPGAAIIVVAMMNEVDMVRQAMLHGAQGFLLKPFSEAELLSSVRQAYDLVVRRRAELANLPRLVPGAKAAQRAIAEIVAVYSPKGGVGCTTVAINLAVALKRTTGKRTILMDGDLGFGDVDTALNISSSTSISTLLPNLDELDDLFLEGALARHSSGIKVLIGPPYLEAAGAISPEDLRQLVMRLAGLGDGYVVVDASSALDDRTLSVLDICHHLVVITTPQVTALRDAHRFLEVLNLLGYNSQKAMLVLNHCYQRSTVRLKEVERALGHPVAQIVEYAPLQVTASLNRGVPLLQEYPDSPAARNILGLANHIVSRREGQKEHSSKPVERASSKNNKSKKGRLFSRNRSAASDGVEA